MFVFNETRHQKTFSFTNKTAYDIKASPKYIERKKKRMNILNIAEQPMFDDRFVKLVTHTYNPYANSTSIRITCESFLNVEGKVVIKHRNDESIIKLGNNCIAFMLDEIRYELNGVEIDYNRNVGITSTLKNYISFTCDEDKIMKNAGWNIRWNDEKNDL
ncbi:uncharacterized protein LOC143187758 [Calliopsis andreniformis]|uniref:uncharacterized protein LOC143187758 n=1 Tax=Calliopsis andreniformis TaxID=337506 RepID=UPI003FCCA9ED